MKSMNDQLKVAFMVILFILHSAAAEQREVTQAQSNNEDGSTNMITSYITSACERGWFEFGGRCYGVGSKLGIGKLNFDNAVKKCKEREGQLASIHSKKLTDFLRTFVLMEIRDVVWIGMHDQVKDNEYEWVDGTQINYTNWRNGEPSSYDTNSNKEDCVELLFMAYPVVINVAGYWNDVVCHKRIDFVCEKKKSKKGSIFPDPRFCSDGGWKYRTSCYHIMTESMTWSQAEEYCIKNHNGHLATIKDWPTNTYFEYILRNYSQDFWIGIKIQNKFPQQWTSGWFVSFSKWIKDPDEVIEESCVIRSPRDEWITIPCDTPTNFICETSSVSPPSLKSSDELLCPGNPSDWSDIGGDYCYHIDTKNYFSWSEANMMCMRRGGNLINIHSKTESDVLQQFLLYFQPAIWIGYYRNAYDGNFVWTDGTPNNFTFFAENEPSNVKEECVEIRPGDMRWNDIACNSRRGYICSIKKITSNETITTEIVPMPCSRTSPFSIISLLGVLLCVVVVFVLLGIVVYNIRPLNQEEIKKPRLPCPPREEKIKYRNISEIIIKEDT